MSERTEARLAQLTLEEKVGLCHGATQFWNGEVPRLGIPALVMLDGPCGVREELDPLTMRAMNRGDDAVTALRLRLEWKG